MDHLKGYLTVGDLEEALDHLPRGRTGLGKAYDQAIDRIKSQSEPCCQMAMRVLSWLTHCKRALFPKELQQALGTRPGQTDLDRQFLPDIDIIDSVCAGLVVFDQNTRRIRLVHYTTKEYLLGHPAFRNSEAEIAQTCMAYLSFAPFSSGRYRNISDYEHLEELYPLHHYCGQYWAAHASAALDTSEEFIKPVVVFLENDSNVHAAASVVMPHSVPRDTMFPNWLHFIPRQLTKIHIAASGGLTSVITEYIRRNEEVDIRDPDGGTPLAYAAKAGHLDTTRVLLESKRVDPDSKDTDGRTPLLLAASGEYKEVVHVLIQYGACPNHKDRFGSSALGAAAASGDIETMRLLLDHGAQINQQCPSYHEYDGTPLMNARCSGNTDAVLFLLERGADPNFPNVGGVTILSAVARNNDEELVKLLLESGVQVDPKGHFGATPLAYAVEQGFLGITEKLIKAGADVNMQNHDGQSVLMMACDSAESNEEIIHELLHHGANPNIQDSSLETPLSISTKYGSLGVVKLLLDKGADPNIPGKRGETALFRAAEEGHGDLINALLHNKADPHICNEAFQTALFCAVRKGHVSVVNLLLDAGSDVHAQDIAGSTPLFYAASSGSEEVVRLLLEKGAQNDHRNALQETALFFAARYGWTAVANLLIEAGATPDPRNLIMESPLIYAAGWLDHIISRPSKRKLDYSSVVTLLLENGADPNPRYNPTFQSKSQFESWEVLWSSPIHRLCMPPRLQNACCEAARHIWKSRVQEYDDEQILIFLECLVYEDSTYFRRLWRKGEATPLLWAVRGCHVDLVKRLLRAGVSIEIQNKGRTDIFIEAVESGNTLIAELLLDDLIDPSAAASHLWSMALHAAAKMGATARNEPHMAKLLSQDHRDDLACDSSDDGDESDICKECRSSGTTCSDDTHRLAKRQRR
jgi:ankyrin repeat protein